MVINAPHVGLREISSLSTTIRAAPALTYVRVRVKVNVRVRVRVRVRAKVRRVRVKNKVWTKLVPRHRRS